MNPFNYYLLQLRVEYIATNTQQKADQLFSLIIPESGYSGDLIFDSKYEEDLNELVEQARKLNAVPAYALKGFDIKPVIERFKIFSDSNTYLEKFFYTNNSYDNVEDALNEMIEVFTSYLETKRIYYDE